MKLQLTAGDTWPTTGTLKDSTGVAINLSGYTIAMAIEYETPLIKTAVVTDAANGVFEFRWAESDLVAGTPDAIVTVTNAGGQLVSSQRITLEIGAKIPPPEPAP